MDNVVYASDQAELCRDIKKDGWEWGDECFMKGCFKSSSRLRYPLFEEIDQILGKVRSKKPQTPSKPFGNLKELPQVIRRFGYFG